MHSGRQAFLLLRSDYRRRHECWCHRIDDTALEDVIDVVLRRRVDVPAFDISDRIELAGMSGTPEGDRWALIEHPAHRKCQYRFAKALSRQLLEFADRSEILAEAFIPEFRVDFAEIIAVELGFQGHPSAQETTTERSVA